MKILVAEDDRVSQRLLEMLLKRWGHEVILASDGRQALDIMLSKDIPPLVLLDWEMPDMDGIDVCRKIREKEMVEAPYIIFLTAKDSSEYMVQGLEAGASDFIRKPFQKEELKARINVGIRTITLQQQLVSAHRMMERIAMQDLLTGVYNRRAMLEILPREIARAKREGSHLALGILDIDHFKTINDTYGHHAGDAALVAFAQLLKDSTRPYDTVCRWGGEEFMIVAPFLEDSGVKGAEHPLFERIREGTEQLRVKVDTRNLGFTVSIGLSMYTGEEEMEEVIRRADEALYDAKRSGRNRIAAHLAPSGTGDLLFRSEAGSS
jgi:diguanylate cyclase (GGDEF)-like protein